MINRSNFQNGFNTSLFKSIKIIISTEQSGFTRYIYQTCIQFTFQGKNVRYYLLL